MGMYDSFIGYLTCPHCKEKYKFEAQTKEYKCILDEFLLGDYVHDDKSTKVYKFNSVCCNCKKKHEGNIIIFEGQVINFVNNDELKEIDLNNLEHIEKGIGHRLEYLKRCEKGIGSVNEEWLFCMKYENEHVNWEEHPKRVGDIIYTMQRDWIIKEVLKEELVDGEVICGRWYKEAYVYKVYNKELGNRVMRVTKNNIELWYDKGDYKEYDFLNPYNFYIPYGYVLKSI